MQLFLTDFEKLGDNVTIQNTEILNQIRKVLRMKLGDIVFVQKDFIRCGIEITDWDDKKLLGKILKITNFHGKLFQNSILVAMPNKREKIELIVQKLTEIGIKHIYFRPSERSIIRQRNEKKLERLEKISKEAIEQSWGRQIPEIRFSNSISEFIEGKDVIVFDKITTSVDNHKDENNQMEGQQILGIIGPEGGLTENDYKSFGNIKKCVSLGDTILRTETASIIAGWILGSHIDSIS